MNIPQTLEYANGIYYNSVNTTELEQARGYVKELIEKRRPTAENLARAEGLCYRLTAKIVAIAYFDGGYEEDAYNALISELESGLSTMDAEAYPKTVHIYQKLLSAARSIHAVVSDVGNLLASIQDGNGRCIIDQPEKLRYVETLFLEKKNRLTAEVEDTSSLFGGSVNMFDVKERAIADVDALYEWTKNERNKIDGRDVEAFLSHNFEDVDKIDDFPCLVYSESLVTGAYNGAKAYVLSSPLQDEVLFFTKAYSYKNGLPFLKVSAYAFEGKTSSFISKIFDYLEKSSANLLVFGLKEYHGENKDGVLETLLRYSKKGFFVFAVDHSGERTLYDEFMQISTKAEGLSPLDVSCNYLRMPAFAQVVNIYQEKNMIGFADSEFVRENMPYMGYVGFNKSIWLFTEGKEWKDCAIRYSHEHGSKISDYLQNLPSQDQFISRDWVDLNLEERNTLVRGDFDYDDVHSLNPKNIRKIVQSDVNLFVKCGLSARYCTLCGDDFSVWKNLDREEREKRMSVATKLVAHLLDCIYVPEVKIIPDEEWTEKGAGGYCANGGKLIVYKNDCTLGYDWAVKAICHECYHAFQHTVIESGFREWHFTSLGVSKHRSNEWNSNFQHYVSIGKNKEGYMRQVVEADARIFEEDCHAQSSNKWNLFDLE